MPIYEYECSKCGSQTEVWQKITDAPMVRCEACKGKMKRLISHSTFHLKGSGWYVTDYASNRGGESGKKEKAAAETDVKSAKPDAASEKPKKETSSGKGNVASCS